MADSRQQQNLIHRLAQRVQVNRHGSTDGTYDSIQYGVAQDHVREVMRAGRDERILIITEDAHEKLRRQRDVAQNSLRWADERIVSTFMWGESQAAEVRRLSDRLNKIIALAAANGVDVIEIEKALTREEDEINRLAAAASDMHKPRAPQTAKPTREPQKASTVAQCLVEYKGEGRHRGTMCMKDIGHGGAHSALQGNLIWNDSGITKEPETRTATETATEDPSEEVSAASTFVDAKSDEHVAADSTRCREVYDRGGQCERYKGHSGAHKTRKGKTIWAQTGESL